MGKAKSRNRSKSYERQHKAAKDTDPGGWRWMGCTGVHTNGEECTKQVWREELSMQRCEECGKRSSRAELIACGRCDLVDGDMAQRIWEQTLAALKRAGDWLPPDFMQKMHAAPASSWSGGWSGGRDWAASGEWSGGGWAEKDGGSSWSKDELSLEECQRRLAEAGVPGASTLKLPEPEPEEVKGYTAKEEDDPELARCNEALRTALSAKELADTHKASRQEAHAKAVEWLEVAGVEVRDAEEKSDEAQKKLEEAAKEVREAKEAFDEREGEKQASVERDRATARSIRGVAGLAELLDERRAAEEKGDEEEAAKISQKLAALWVTNPAASKVVGGTVPPKAQGIVPKAQEAVPPMEVDEEAARASKKRVVETRGEEEAVVEVVSKKMGDDGQPTDMAVDGTGDAGAGRGGDGGSQVGAGSSASTGAATPKVAAAAEGGASSASSAAAGATELVAPLPTVPKSGG
jgi:hypothetical protein